VSYLEGCTAPMRDENQLHAAVVELVALDDAQIKYSTVQNWYPGRRERRRRHLQLRDQARRMPRRAQQDQLDPGGNRFGDHLEVPELRAARRRFGGRVLFGGADQHRQQADTGTKMIHLGRNTKSKIMSKGISAGRGQNTYRGLVKVEKGAEGARNFTQCDSLLIGKQCGAHTFPYIEVKHPGAIVEHEATTSKISDDQLFYCRSRGIWRGRIAVSLIVDGFCKDQVFKRTADGIRGGGQEAAGSEPGRGVSDEGQLLQARDAFTATLLRDGRVLVVGGYADGEMRPLAQAEIYDPATASSSATGDLGTARRSHTATLLGDGSVLIAGGSDTRRSVTATLERFDPATDGFLPAGTLAKARHKHAAVRMGDEVLFLGGAGIPEPDGYFVDTERWNATTRETTPGPTLAEGRYKFLDAVVVLPDGDVLVAGGGRHAERLDRGLVRFVRVRAALGVALAFSTVTPLNDGRILVAGGYDPDIRTRRSAWIYAPRDGSAITLAHEF
jgi:hypothetical protein